MDVDFLRVSVRYFRKGVRLQSLVLYFVMVGTGITGPLPLGAKRSGTGPPVHWKCVVAPLKRRLSSILCPGLYGKMGKKRKKNVANLLSDHSKSSHQLTKHS